MEPGVKEIFQGMPQRLNQNLAKGLDAVCQFNITGDGGGNWYLVIKEGACQVNEGTAQGPKVTLTMGTETWIGMVNKKVNGMQAFMMGKLKVTGDVTLAQRIPALFSL
ncbi:MAG: SCP-2 family sterol carrier protein [Desulfobacteraceae bacterium]|nr:MAG: SCP-2 family sterol carrier protein [Desulfobacteraceae bacterium]